MTETRLIGYARVSTKEQNLALQIAALKKAGVLDDNLHVEKIGGTAKNRPALDLAIKDCREGDTFLVWRLDRVARNQEDFHARMRAIHKAGAAFKSLTEDFDFSTFTGQFVLTILAAVAQLERQITVARTSAGIAALKERTGHKNWKWGPKVIMTKAKIERAGKLLNGGMSGPKVAAKLNVSTASIYAFWKHAGKHKFVRKVKRT